MKLKPKSCSCRQCRYSNKHAKFQMKSEERAFRHSSKIALKTGRDEDIVPALHGSYRA